MILKIYLSLLLIITFLTPLLAQNFVADQGIYHDLQKKYLTKITFMNKPIPLDKYQTTDMLSVFTLKKKSDLNIRVFLAKSLTNELHDLAPEYSVNELVNSGNYRFSFYLDKLNIYNENLDCNAGTLESKNSMTIFRIPLLSSNNEDSWGRFLWNRFLIHGGNEHLSPGIHSLKIEIRPYIYTSPAHDNYITGHLIAEGEISLIVPSKKIKQKAINIQFINKHQDWELSTEKFDSLKIIELNKKILEDRFKEISSIIVVKNNRLILEEYFNGTHRKTLQDTRSVGKSFCSALIGLAIEDKLIPSLKKNLGDYYNLSLYPNYSPKKEHISLEQLITMSSPFEGSDQNPLSLGQEEKIYSSKNWIDFILSLPLDNMKLNLETWDYFSGGTIILGDILNKSTPKGIKSYADNKLFKPLNIVRYKWQFTPQNIPNMSGSLRMSALDLAKFGLLYQNKGLWKNQRILSETWVENSMSEQIVIPDKIEESYGYLFWNKNYIIDQKLFRISYASGNGGNRIVIFKDYSLVFVITAKAFNQPFAQTQIDTIIEKYLIPAFID